MVEQPPLQFYVRVMQNQAWDRVDVVTYADRPESLNPVVAALQARKAEGELMENFHIHTVSRSVFFPVVGVRSQLLYWYTLPLWRDPCEMTKQMRRTEFLDLAAWQRYECRRAVCLSVCVHVAQLRAPVRPSRTHPLFYPSNPGCFSCC